MTTGNQLSELWGNFYFRKIFRAFRIAIQPSKLLIAFLVFAVLSLYGWIMDLHRTVVTPYDLSVAQMRSYQRGDTGITDAFYPSELHCYLANPGRTNSYIKEHLGSGSRAGVFSLLWHFGSARFTEAALSICVLDLGRVAVNIRLFTKALMWALRFHTIYSVPYFAGALAVIAVGGGAICRIAAVQFARGEKPGLTEALQFSLKKFVTFFAAPLAPFGIIVFFGLFVFVLGIIGNLPRAGELIMAVFLLIALLAGLLMALALVGTIGGINLIYPSIAYEGSDAFDAVGRTFGYVYAHPWRMGFYTFLATFYGGVCYLFVRFFVFLLLFVTRLFLQLGVWTNSSIGGINKLSVIWPEPRFLDLLGTHSGLISNRAESIASFLVNLVLSLVFGLIVSFVLSFYFSANTIIYALMRKHTDNTAAEEIYAQAEHIQLEQENPEQ